MKKSEDESTDLRKGNYSLREHSKVDYNPAPKYRRPPKANMSLIEKSDQELPSLLSYRSKCEPTQECDVPDAIHIEPTDPTTKPISIAPPRNRREAITSPWWAGYHAAELTEMQSHIKNQTWTLIPRSDVPAGAPILRDRWAYDDKLAAGGKKIERFKARLTAMGCFQKAGIDYTETYACRQECFDFYCKCITAKKQIINHMEHWMFLLLSFMRI